MTDEQIAEIWMLFKEYLDKKHIETAAERFVDLMADYGVTDMTLTEVLGADAQLDTAINYYLDIDSEDVYDDEIEEWDN